MKIKTKRMITGRPSAVITPLRRRIAANIRFCISLKIGITSNPKERALDYSSEYDDMMLLYKTSSDNYVKDMERRMICEYWDYVDNSIGGGGGRLGSAPYFLYIVRRWENKASTKRRSERR